MSQDISKISFFSTFVSPVLFLLFFSVAFYQIHLECKEFSDLPAYLLRPTEKKISFALGEAQKQILLQTSQPLSEEMILNLTKAFKRGVKVKVLYDSSHEKKIQPTLNLIKSLGVEIRSKPFQSSDLGDVIILDDKVLVSGKYEVLPLTPKPLLVFSNPKLVKLFLKEWERSYT